MHIYIYIYLIHFAVHLKLTTYCKSTMCVCAKSLQLCPTLCNLDCSPPGLCVHRDSPSTNTGVGCHGLLQGIFPTQGSNVSLFSLLR